ncbi:MAG: ABC transporter permease [Acidimicrobiia bacterium]|nr:ABC transporter permease [Acidimicrobiia bacterium]
MQLAIAEIRRRRGRWASIIGAVAFIVFLVLILAALADGLFIGSTGAFRNSDADAYVYSADGRRSLVRSALPVEDLESVTSVEGVADAGALGILLATAATDGDLFDIAVIGHLPGRVGEPTALTAGRRPATGEQFVGLADMSLRDKGIELGSLVLLTGSAQPVEVVGFVSDARYLLADTLWVTLETWESLRFEIRPETVGGGSVAQAFPIAVSGGAGVEAVTAAIDAALGTTETVTADEAILSLPGVEQQASTFTAIIVVSFVVVGIVIALFFALITLEKRGQLAILKAIGSSNYLLLRGVLIQALIATVAGYVLGFALSRLLALVLPPAVPVEFLAGTARTLFLATIVMGALGAVLSFRRIIRIDPASALGGEA